MKQLDIIVHKDEDTGKEISWGITHDDGSVKWYDTRDEANYYFSDAAVLNDDGDTVTRITVMHLFSYDVEQIVQQLREDNRVGDNDALEITLDDVLERISTMAEDDFLHGSVGLIFQDQDGNNY
jgi:hypothetical protein